MQAMTTKPHRAVSYQESSIMKAAESAGSLIAEIKYDGFRCNLLLWAHQGDSAWLTREGTVIESLAHLQEKLWANFTSLMADQENPFPRGVMVDGEVMVKGVSFQKGSGLLRTKWLKAENAEWHGGHIEYTAKGKIKPKQPFQLKPELIDFVAYDIVPVPDVISMNDYEVPTVVRVEHAKHMVKMLRHHAPIIDWCSPASWDVFSIEMLHQLYEEVREQGHEGLIVKDPFAPYRRGKKTGMWKLKPENEVDGEVTGIIWGTKGLANEGKVIGFRVLLETGVEVDATNISKALMSEFTLAVKNHSLDNGGFFIAHGLGVNGPCYTNPYEGWKCQVNFMEYTEEGSLRHPTFGGWRGMEGNETLKV